jgi:nucleoside-diphosphate-sugar epimerase
LKVLVTGATGFIGTHVVRELLERGHHVRGTVRSLDPARVGHLHVLPGADERLELRIGDVLEPGAFDEAAVGCDGACHVASAVKLAARDPQREIVDVAVQGTHNVLESVRRAGTIRRYVQTSSVAAVMSYGESPDRVFSEEDWARGNSVKNNPYGLAKTLAERAAWDFRERLSERERFDVVCINPSVAVGPVYVRAHLRTSPGVVYDAIAGSCPGCPRLRFGLVDVREVATAHALALESPQANGRYVLNGGSLWFRELCDVLRPHFPDRPIPRRHLPGLLLYVAALFDERLSVAFLKNNLGAVYNFDSRRSVSQLGVRYRPLEESLVDCARSILDRGLVPSR